MRLARMWGLAVAFWVVTAGNLFAEGGMSSVQTSGFLDLYYSYNGNKPSTTNKTGYSNFDFNHNSISLNLIELVFQKKADPAGFRIDLNFGDTTDVVHSSAWGPANNATETYKHIQQAYVTWVTPGNITLDVGKFVTHMGAEVIESNANWNYTRGLLFAYAIPYYHTGLRANFPISDQVYVNGYLYNGWNNVLDDTNPSNTYGVTIGVTPIKELPIVFNWVGPEESDSFKALNVYDLVVTYNATDALSFMFNYDHGRRDPLAGGASETYAGVAAYAKWSMKPCVLAFRFEHLEDDDGVLFGEMDNAVQEFTLTGEHEVAKNLLVRLEYRHDSADASIYTTDDPGSPTDRQDRVVAGLIYSF